VLVYLSKSITPFDERCYTSQGDSITMGWQHGWGGMMGGGWFAWLLLLVLLVVLGVWAARAFSGGAARPGGTQYREPPRSERETPLEILQSRYARGEISREEYEEMRRDLQSS
jgi:putative membrane protein